MAARIAGKLLGRKLGFRALLDVIPLDASLVKGSHGVPAPPEQGPLAVTDTPALLPSARLKSTDICGLILRHVFNA